MAEQKQYVVKLNELAGLPAHGVADFFPRSFCFGSSNIVDIGPRPVGTKSPNGRPSDFPELLSDLWAIQGPILQVIIL